MQNLINDINANINLINKNILKITFYYQIFTFLR